MSCKPAGMGENDIDAALHIYSNICCYIGSSIYPYGGPPKRNLGHPKFLPRFICSHVFYSARVSGSSIVTTYTLSEINGIDSKGCRPHSRREVDKTMQKQIQCTWPEYDYANSVDCARQELEKKNKGGNSFWSHTEGYIYIYVYIYICI